MRGGSTGGWERRMSLMVSGGAPNWMFPIDVLTTTPPRGSWMGERTVRSEGVWVPRSWSGSGCAKLKSEEIVISVGSQFHCSRGSDGVNDCSEPQQLMLNSNSILLSSFFFLSFFQTERRISENRVRVDSFILNDWSTSFSFLREIFVYYGMISCNLSGEIARFFIFPVTANLTNTRWRIERKIMNIWWRDRMDMKLFFLCFVCFVFRVKPIKEDIVRALWSDLHLHLNRHRLPFPLKWSFDRLMSRSIGRFG